MRHLFFTVLGLFLLGGASFADEHGSEGEYLGEPDAGYQGEEEFESPYRNELDLDTYNLFEDSRRNSERANLQPSPENSEFQALPALETTVEFELRRADATRKQSVNLPKIQSTAQALGAAPASTGAGSAIATATANTSNFNLGFGSAFPAYRTPIPNKPADLALPAVAVAPAEREVRRYQKVLYIPSNGMGAELGLVPGKKNTDLRISERANQVWNRGTGRESEDPDVRMIDELVVAEESPQRSIASVAEYASSEAESQPLNWFWLSIPLLLAGAFLAGRWDQRRRVLRPSFAPEPSRAIAPPPRPHRERREDTFDGTIFHKRK